MIIFTRDNNTKIAIRPSSVVSVEDCLENAAMSFIDYLPNRQKKAVETIRVKHTLQEVVDALNKVESWL
jgi:phage major head subunit gpT-like protein